MKPVDFDGTTAVLGKEQKEYIQLPAHVGNDNARTVTTCWELTWRERLRVLLGGVVWWQQMTFGRPLQPMRPSTTKPNVEELE